MVDLLVERLEGISGALWLQVLIRQHVLELGDHAIEHSSRDLNRQHTR